MADLEDFSIGINIRIRVRYLLVFLLALTFAPEVAYFGNYQLKKWKQEAAEFDKLPKDMKDRFYEIRRNLGNNKEDFSKKDVKKNIALINYAVDSINEAQKAIDNSNKNNNLELKSGFIRSALDNLINARGYLIQVDRRIFDVSNLEKETREIAASLGYILARK